MPLTQFLQNCAQENGQPQKTFWTNTKMQANNQEGKKLEGEGRKKEKSQWKQKQITFSRRPVSPPLV